MPYRCSVIAYWAHTAEAAASEWPDHVRYPIDTTAGLVALFRALDADPTIRVVWMWGPPHARPVVRLTEFHAGVDDGACGGISLNRIHWQVDLRVAEPDTDSRSAVIDDLHGPS